MAKPVFRTELPGHLMDTLATSEQTYWDIDLTLGVPLRYGLGFMLGGETISADTLTYGREQYMLHCYACHGSTRKNRMSRATPSQVGTLETRFPAAAAA